jgi:hypothetical protein
MKTITIFIDNVNYTELRKRADNVIEEPSQWRPGVDVSLAADEVDP